MLKYSESIGQAIIKSLRLDFRVITCEWYH